MSLESMSRRQFLEAAAGGVILAMGVEACADAKKDLPLLNVQGSFERIPTQPLKGRKITIIVHETPGLGARIAYVEPTFWYDGAVNDNTDNEAIGNGKKDGWPKGRRETSPQQDGSWLIEVDLDHPDHRAEVLDPHTGQMIPTKPIPQDSKFSFSINVSGYQHGEFGRNTGCPGPIDLLRGVEDQNVIFQPIDSISISQTPLPSPEG